MSTLTLDLDLDVAVDAPGPGDDPREGPTLDDVVVGAWEGLAADLTAPCPVCAGSLEPRFGAGAAPVAGRCRDCGSELS